MRGHVPSYDLRTPTTLGEALTLMAREPGVWQPFAGGTDLMVQMESGVLAQKQLVSLWGLPELRGIRVEDDVIEIGALTTYAQVQAHDGLRREFPILCQAGAETGGLAIQNRGTIGGNIAHASPAADTPPVLLCLDAELELVSANGVRRVPYSAFHVGYKKTALQPGELIRCVRLPRMQTKPLFFYRKVGTRKAQAISKVVMAAVTSLDGVGLIVQARVAVGSVGPVTMRCVNTEAALVGRRPDETLASAVRAVIEAEVMPRDDVRASAEFRVHVTGNLIVQLVTQLAASRTSGPG